MASKKQNLSDLIHDDAVLHALNLLRFSETVRNQIFVLLEDLADDILAKLSSGKPITAYQAKRLGSLITWAEGTIKTTYANIAKTSKEQFIELSELEVASAVASVNKVLGIELLRVGLTNAEAKAVVDDMLILGGPAKEWWADQGTKLARRFAQQVRLGITAGEANDDIILRILGRQTGVRRVVTVDGEQRVLRLRAGGVMDVSRRDATSLVRTATQTVSNEILWQTYQANDDVLDGVQWLSTLDGRTTPVCRARDGSSWDMAGNPLPDSPLQIPFPGPPPAHWNCRSVLIAIVKSLDKLISDAGGKGAAQVKRALAGLPESTRASMDGQVAASLTYEDWLATKSEAFQKEVLGPARFDLWKNKNISITQMVDPSGRALTLDELSKL